MRSLIAVVAVAMALSTTCPCKQLGDAILNSRIRAEYAASWHYLNPAQQERDWEKGRRWRAYMVRGLFRCQRHNHKRGA